MDVSSVKSNTDLSGHQSVHRSFNKEVDRAKDRTGQDNVGKKLNEITGGDIKEVRKEKTNNQELGKNEFLKLLMAQIKNQDPLKPMDGREMTMQMAQLSSLEQLVNMNTTMNELKKERTQNLLDGSQLIGKYIDAQSNMVNKKDNQEMTLAFKLPTQAMSVEAKVYDLDGKLVQTIKRGSMPEGIQKVMWDGKDKDGRDAVNGEYMFTIIGADNAGKPIVIKPDASGLVTGVFLEKGKPVLRVGELTVKMEDVRSISTEPPKAPLQTQTVPGADQPPAGGAAVNEPITTAAAVPAQASAQKPVTPQSLGQSEVNGMEDNRIYFP